MNKDLEQLVFSNTGGRIVNWYNYFGNLVVL